MTTAGGLRAIVITGGVPGVRASTVRTAVLQVREEWVSEITLESPSSDRGAAREFRRLVDSARAAPVVSPEMAVASALSAGRVGGAAHPAGPILLGLTADYEAGDRFTLATADEKVRYHLEASPGPGALAAMAGGGTLLADGVGFAQDERGTLVRVETDVRPRLYGSREGGAVFPESTMGMAPASAPAASPARTVVESEVRGRPVVLMMEGAGGEGPSPEELLRAMNGRAAGE
jgi:hypothetical protein